MFLPIRTDSRLRSTPYMNWAIIAANVLVFALQGPLDLEMRWILDGHHLRWWNFITYAFLHADVWHIAGNMLFLYIFGNNVNDKMGSFAYLGYYLAGAVFAGLGFTLISGGAVLGASGAVAAVTGAYLVLFPRANITIAYIWLFFGTFEVPSVYVIGFFFAQDLLFGLAGLGHRGMGGVAYMAHVAGTLYGVVICTVLLWLHMLPRDQWDVIALFDRSNRRRQYRDLTASGYNPFSYVNDPRSKNGPPPLPTAREQGITEVRMSIANAIAAHEMERAAKLFLELKELDPSQVLSRQAQLDIANQLAGQQLYLQAAEAYEQFLKTYPKFEQIEQVELMLGLIYARYLAQYPRAHQCLVRALAKLHGQREIDMARGELTRIEMLMAGVK